MSTDDRINEFKRETLDRMFGPLEKACESPIEKLFLWAVLADALIVHVVDDSHDGAVAHGAAGDPDATLIGTYVTGGPESGLVTALIFQQWKVAPYRLDFAVTFRHADGLRERIAVELDGHEFHERTKAQAERDKKRDRVLATAGWRVIRFTGSEVHRDAAACVDQVTSLVDAVISQHVGAPTA